MEEALMPDLDRKVYKTVRAVKESRPKSEGEKLSEAFASLIGYGGWEGGLKPYIKTRIERLKAMFEVPIDGKESLEEVGIRAVVCSAVANELQDLLNWVEINAQQVEKKK